MTWVLTLHLFMTDPRGLQFWPHLMVQAASFQTFDQCMTEARRVVAAYDVAWTEERDISADAIGYANYAPWLFDGDAHCDPQRGAQS